MSVAARSSPSPLENDLLATLSQEVQQRLFPVLELYPLPLGKVLYRSGDTLTHAYFPTDAIVSLLHVLRGGETAEVSIVGKDGFIGVSRLMGGNSTLWTSVVQSQGSAFRLPIGSLMDEFRHDNEVMMMVLTYTHALMTQMAQTAVCNRHHNLLQRMTRLLLVSLDRLAGLTLNMTHEQIANMLGVRREGVTGAAGKLQKLGLIKYERGQITVLERAGLERLTCECYGVVKKEIERLLKNSLKLQRQATTPRGPGRSVRLDANIFPWVG